LKKSMSGADAWLVSPPPRRCPLKKETTGKMKNEWENKKGKTKIGVPETTDASQTAHLASRDGPVWNRIRNHIVTHWDTAKLSDNKKSGTIKIK
jgi:hypothetical protein